MRPLAAVSLAAALAVGLGSTGVRLAGLGAELIHPPLAGPRTPPAPANTAFAGLTTFRGNASRTYLGEGPVPSAPVIRWRYPAEGPMCSLSPQGLDGTPLQEWCGVGWTGQPNVIERPGRAVEIRQGAYDGRYHFLDGGTGTPIRPSLVTGDLAKGSATTDPDGFPLYYAGSRDDRLRIVALDRASPTVLWELDATTSVAEPKWNDDWDAAPLVLDGFLLATGENGWFYAIELNRGYDDEGRVVVAPRVVATAPSWDEELLAAIGDEDVSIESSVAVHDGVAYVANSGGLVQGWDLGDVLAGGADLRQVFRFWTGDDTDATIVIDEEGFLYVASEFQRFNDRSRALGQLMKLDPRRPGDPVVWSIPAPEIGFLGAGGSWSTPALWGDLVVFTTAAGRVLGVDRESGEIRWELQIGAPTIASPVVVDGALVLGDCSGHLYAWDLGTDPGAAPRHRWTLDLGDCIEATPAVWRGWLFVGTREGYLYGIADPQAPAPT